MNQVKKTIPFRYEIGGYGGDFSNWEMQGSISGEPGGFSDLVVAALRDAMEKLAAKECRGPHRITRLLIEEAR